MCLNFLSSPPAQSLISPTPPSAITGRRRGAGSRQRGPGACARGQSSGDRGHPPTQSHQKQCPGPRTAPGSQTSTSGTRSASRAAGKGHTGRRNAADRVLPRVSLRLEGALPLPSGTRASLLPNTWKPPEGGKQGKVRALTEGPSGRRDPGQSRLVTAARGPSPRTPGAAGPPAGLPLPGGLGKPHAHSSALPPPRQEGDRSRRGRVGQTPK